jgi:hypothetical protein
MACDLALYPPAKDRFPVSLAHSMNLPFFNFIVLCELTWVETSRLLQNTVELAAIQVKVLISEPLESPLSIRTWRKIKKNRFPSR